ncbi:hypothetical protein CASFOL_025359 [Castilleja foliolosa]|uniref:DUF6821 domain-containing protein n=1 Tax=Castilleja foliolosa TaxID=1961234 RepID=A0ABD3CQX5_9LAMI
MNCLNQADLQDWELLPQEEFDLDSKQHDERDSDGIKAYSKPSKEIKSCEKSVEESDDGGNLKSIWKWSLNGISTICSFGVAAASFCIIILGNNRKNEMIKNQQSRKLDDAISALGSAIITRARVTVGGYYDTNL